VHVLLWVCYSIISFSESNALLTLSKAQIISTGVHGHGACRVCCREFHQSVNSCLSGEIELKSESLEYKLILAQDGSRVSKMAHFERKVRESEASPCLCSCRGKRGRPLVNVEFDEIKQTIELEKEFEGNSWTEFWSTPGNRHRSIILISIGFFSQWSGNGIVSYFLPQVCSCIVQFFSLQT